MNIEDWFIILFVVGNMIWPLIFSYCLLRDCKRFKENLRKKYDLQYIYIGPSDVELKDMSQDPLGFFVRGLDRENEIEYQVKYILGGNLGIRIEKKHSEKV